MTNVISIVTIIVINILITRTLIIIVIITLPVQWRIRVPLGHHSCNGVSDLWLLSKVEVGFVRHLES